MQRGLPLVASLLVACGGAGAPPEPPTDLLPLALEHAVDARIVPAMRAFADEARTLREEVDRLCPSPDKADVLAWQARYLELWRRWSAASIYNLGPLDDDIIVPSIIFIESMRLRGTDYTETVRAHLADTLASQAPLDDAFFEDLGFKNVGLLALEVLLFERSGARSSTTADVALDFAEHPKKCAYLRGIATLLERRAAALVTGWTSDFKGSGRPFSEILVAGELEDGAQPAPALLLSIAEHIDYVEKRKLDAILDLRLAAAASPGPDPFFVNLGYTLGEIEALLAGYSDAGVSFADLMGRRGYADEVAGLRLQLEATRAAARQADRERTRAAVDELQHHLSEAVPDALGVHLGINFSDGD